MNKNHINILIKDTNRYFAQGLAALLHEECLNRHTRVAFLTLEHQHRADIIIVTDNTYSFISTGSSSDEPARQSQLLIQDSIRYQTASWVQPYIGMIKRRDSIRIIRAAIELMLTRHYDIPAQKVLSGRPTLTARENDILSALARGLTPKQIARLYGLNVKTVSSHKRAAMRKMGLARIHDLYHWLYNQNALAPERHHGASVVA